VLYHNGARGGNDHGQQQQRPYDDVVVQFDTS
jgi:hypothetical protein